MAADIIKIKNMFPEDFLGSRFAGETVRKAIEASFALDRPVILDFEGISGITQSFGDEVVGLFVRVFGLDFVKKNIFVVNVNEEIRNVLNFVVKYSKPHHQKTSTHSPMPVAP